jgi:hypothetical protein
MGKTAIVTGAFLVLAQAARRVGEGGRSVALSSSVGGEVVPRVRPLHRFESGCRGARSGARERVARPRHHRGPFLSPNAIAVSHAPEARSSSKIPTLSDTFRQF